MKMTLSAARRYVDENTLGGLVHDPAKTYLALRVILERGMGNKGLDVGRADKLQYARATIRKLSDALASRATA